MLFNSNGVAIEKIKLYFSLTLEDKYVILKQKENSYIRDKYNKSITIINIFKYINSGATYI